MRSRLLIHVVALVGLAIALSACESDDPAAPQLGAITVDAAPDSIAAPWQLSGPSGVLHTGEGDAALADLPAGSYTLTWGGVPGWQAPDPQAVTQTLDGDGALVFAGAYLPTVGVIAIDPEPDRLAAPWHLYGPDGYSLEGAGDLDLSGLAPGLYHLNWLPVPDWLKPDPETEFQTLVAGSALTFTGTYAPVTGTLGIVVTPDGIGAPWQVTGPDGFNRQGVDDENFGAVPVGSYTVTWGEVETYFTPQPQTWSVTANQPFTFHAYYELLALPFPDSAWQLMSNFLVSYERMSADDYAALMHPDFVTILQQGTIDDFPDVGPTLDAAEERRLHERLFSKQDVVDPEGSLVPGVKAFILDYYDMLDGWALAPAGDPIPNAECARFHIECRFDRGISYSTLKVEGVIKFYVTHRDSVADGVTRPYYQMLGQLDLTREYKSEEFTSWGTVKALFR